MAGRSIRHESRRRGPAPGGVRQQHRAAELVAPLLPFSAPAALDGHRAPSIRGGDRGVRCPRAPGVRSGHPPVATPALRDPSLSAGSRGLDLRAARGRLA